MEHAQSVASAEYWDSQAAAGPTAAVIDPSDRSGRKNRYIDLLQRKALLDVLNIDGAQVLDFGCGTGRLLPFLKSKAKFVIGADVSQELLRFARVHEDEGGCRVLHYDGNQLPIDRESVNAVVSVGSLQCVTDNFQFKCMARQLADVVKPGGAIYLLEQVRARDGEWQRRETEYVDALTEAGCECKERYPIRNGRGIVLYAIRYGLIPARCLPALAAREMRLVRSRVASPWVRYQDWIFEFRKPALMVSTS